MRISFPAESASSVHREKCRSGVGELYIGHDKGKGVQTRLSLSHVHTEVETNLQDKIRRTRSCVPMGRPNAGSCSSRWVNEGRASKGANVYGSFTAQSIRHTLTFSGFNYSIRFVLCIKLRQCSMPSPLNVKLSWPYSTQKDLQKDRNTVTSLPPWAIESIQMVCHMESLLTEESCRSLESEDFLTE